eukprot:TRINITY_DN3257_c0_g2_i1.p1 TRINITY_DN3257_c0_g2~~TRINITY_DN3257_c0_g2_i1.p1  ORF type:complete len:315 (+),score=73.29 TRINITY_DN3257_c0_g2_i1:50-946(+)
MLKSALVLSAAGLAEGLMFGGAASQCTTCTNYTACPAATGGCTGSTPYCVRHGNACVCKSTDIGTSGHAQINFKAGTPKFKTATYDVMWEDMPLTGFNCYASSMIYWEAVGGYMGSQFHSDGTQMLDFAIWDVNSSIKNSKPLGECSRFGGEGEGSHCEKKVSLKLGNWYRFHVGQQGENATGVTWGVTFTDLSTGVVTNVGSLFWDESMSPKKLGSINPGFVTFQEYYTGGNFNSSIGFKGPFGGVDGKTFNPSSAECNSDDHHNCSPCVGKECGNPYVTLYAGEKVPNCPQGKPIW